MQDIFEDVVARAIARSDPADWPLTFPLVEAALAALQAAAAVARGTAIDRDGDVDPIAGTLGPDTIAAGDGDDLIKALFGNDRIEGRAGADTVSGGFGDDTTIGGAGDDSVGADFLLPRQEFLPGTTTPFQPIVPPAFAALAQDLQTLLTASTLGGDDLTDLGPGNDTVFGGGGNDIAIGGEGNDFLAGDLGADTSYGGAGLDTLTGDLDDGYINGVVRGSSFVRELLGIDGTPSPVEDEALAVIAEYLILTGQQGDELHGGADADVLLGWAGPDRLAGDEGDDLIMGDRSFALLGKIFQPGGVARLPDGTIDYADILAGVDTQDALREAFLSGDLGRALVDPPVPAPTPGDAVAALKADVEALRLERGLFDDVISGGTGDDVVFGDRGSDVLDGDAGDDLLDGGEGDDVVSGGTGNDILAGGLGDNVLDGGAGADVFVLLPQAGTTIRDLGFSDDIAGLHGAGLDEIRLDLATLAWHFELAVGGSVELAGGLETFLAGAFRLLSGDFGTASLATDLDITFDTATDGTPLT